MESFGVEVRMVRRTESIWNPAIAMLSGVIKLHPELRMKDKSQMNTLQKQLVPITIVNTFTFKAARPASGYMQN